MNVHLPPLTTHHSPDINSGVRPLHLLSKVGMCGGMFMQLHACYNQACLPVSEIVGSLNQLYLKRKN